MTQKKVLVIGGAGFIGSHVVDAFLAEGHEVEVFDNFSTGKVWNLPLDIRVVEGDIRDSIMRTTIERGGYDIICHLAAQIDVRYSVALPRFDADVNIAGTLNIMEAARKLEKRPRIVFASTGGAMFGDNNTKPPHNEGEPPMPMSPYGCAKLAVENYLNYYVAVHNMDITVLRLANVYGPRQNPEGEAGVVSIFMDKIRNHGLLTVYGDGKSTRDYIYVKDVAQAFLRAALIWKDGNKSLWRRSDLYHIGTGKQTRIIALLDAVIIATDVQGVVYSFAPRRPGEVQHSALDPAKAVWDLGFKAQTSLADGLKETWEWMKDNV